MLSENRKKRFFCIGRQMASFRESPYKKEFFECVRDIAKHPVVQQMKNYPHHGNSTCYQHCMNVAYFNYRICRYLGWDAESAARAGMIHDLFLYDWHTHSKLTGDHFHGLTHPKTALRNAEMHFTLNVREKDIIVNHMWPVTLLSFPRTREGWIIIITDKLCGLLETSRRKKAEV